jgi:MFS family permease
LTDPAPTRRRFPQPFFGWWVVTTTATMFALQNATWGATFGAYLLEVQDEFGWSKAAISSAFSVSFVLSGLIAPGQGWLIDRFSPRFVMRIGALMLGAAFILLSTIDSLWLFWVAVLLIGLGTNLGGFMTMNSAVVAWFVRKRARALGFSSVGLGIGGLIAPTITWSLVTNGWRPTALVTGIVIMVVALPLSALLRRRPADYGLLPDGITQEEADALPDRVPTNVTTVDFTVGEALRDRSFWFVSAGHGMALLSVFVVMVHLVPHLVEGRGWSETSAQWMFGVVSVSSILGQVGGGFLGDRFSKTKISAVCMVGHFTALMMLAFGGGLLIVPAAMIHGLAWGTRGPLMMAIRADFYGMRNFGTIMGYSTMIIMIGPLIGPWFGGAMNDQFGTYKEAFAIIGIATGVSSAFFLLARKPPLPRQAAANSSEE